MAAIRTLADYAERYPVHLLPAPERGREPPARLEWDSGDNSDPGRRSKSYENEMTRSGGYDMGDRKLLAQALRGRIAALESIQRPNDVERRDLEILAKMLECVEERGSEMPTIARSHQR